MAQLEARILHALRGKRKAPVTARELAKKLNLQGKAKKELLPLLEALKEDGRVIEKNGKLLLVESLGLVRAVIVKVTETFGFATPEDGERDVFIPGRMLAGAMPGDEVLLRVTRGRGELPDGEVYKIISESRQRFSAVLELLPDVGAQVVPDRYVRFPLRVNAARLMGAKHGDKVICEVSRRGERHSGHEARILEAFGSADSAAACCAAILSASGISAEFPPEAREQAQAIASGQGIHPKELVSRLDLRDSVIFTIDGADSKDLDDAVSLQKHDDGSWELGVHIADVSYYVTHGTPLDSEALNRGTSVYFADSVVPMLPEELSNGICSLNPDEDRLAFSALMRLAPDGKIESYKFAKTVIRSRVKGVYGEVNAILDGSAGEDILRKYDGLTDTIFAMRELAGILEHGRSERGGVNLETTESKIILDEAGRAVDVRPRERGTGEGMIEEFMLTANEATATFALESALPFVYRVHENPAPDKTAQLFDTLELLGIQARRPKGSVTSAQLADIINRVKGQPAAPIVNTMVLRSMAKARYSELCTGHFGLALKRYAHFTSPIRRYPDLVAHRVLSGFVTGMKPENIKRRFGGYTAETAIRSTEREIAAMIAERGCEDCYKAEFMRAYIGEELEGVVSSVTMFGVYVRLESTVEGLVRVSAFPPGEWQMNSVIAFTEKRTGKRIALGDKLRVRVAAADISAGTVDFSLV